MFSSKERLHYKYCPSCKWSIRMIVNVFIRKHHREIWGFTGACFRSEVGSCSLSYTWVYVYSSFLCFYLVGCLGPTKLSICSNRYSNQSWGSEIWKIWNNMFKWAFITIIYSNVGGYAIIVKLEVEVIKM